MGGRAARQLGDGLPVGSQSPLPSSEPLGQVVLLMGEEGRHRAEASGPPGVENQS